MNHYYFVVCVTIDFLFLVLTSYAFADCCADHIFCSLFLLSENVYTYVMIWLFTTFSFDEKRLFLLKKMRRGCVALCNNIV